MVSSKEIRINFQEIAKEYNLNYFEVLQRFMFERIIERIAVSKYNDNFILKGGLLLSSIFGIDNRVTKDMDTLIKGIDISKDKMLKILNEILSINLKDGVKFDVVNIDDIREEDEYGGNRYHIVGRIDNTKVNLEIDISTGDILTPGELKYKYPSLFDKEKSYLISCYNNETILAEKIETILSKGTFNSRMKDFYDIYMFFTKLKNTIDFDILKKALENTFSRRNSLNLLIDYDEILNKLNNSSKINELWEIYSRKNKYSSQIAFTDIVSVLKNNLDAARQKN